MTSFRVVSYKSIEIKWNRVEAKAGVNLGFDKQLIKAEEAMNSPVRPFPICHNRTPKKHDKPTMNEVKKANLNDVTRPEALRLVQFKIHIFKEPACWAQQPKTPSA